MPALITSCRPTPTSFGQGRYLTPLRSKVAFAMAGTRRLRAQVPHLRRAAYRSSDAASAADQQTPEYRSRLEYTTSLTGLEAGCSLAASALCCAAFYLAKAPPDLSLKFALLIALLFAATLTVCRTFLLERKHQGRLMAEQELKDHDSVFRELRSTAVHYKLAQAISPAHPIALHCYHGFGANTFSWSYVYKSLAKQLQAQVTKHDMPGFGLTERPKNISGYSLEFNGRLGRLVMDAELANAGILLPSEHLLDVGPGINLEQLQSVSNKHRAGQGEASPAVSRASIEAAAASNVSHNKPDSRRLQQTTQGGTPGSDASGSTNQDEQIRDAFQNSEEPPPESPMSSRSSWDSISSAGSTRVLSSKLAGVGDDTTRSSSTTRQGVRVKRILMGHSLGAACAAAEVIHHSQDIAGLILVAPAIISFSSQLKQNMQTEASRKDTHLHTRIVRVLKSLGEAVAKRTVGLVLWLIQPALVLFLRVLVRSRMFWVRGLSNAWHSRDGVSDELVDAYRLPQLVRGWEIGLVRFVRARVADERSFPQLVKDAYNCKIQQSQAEQLAHTVSQQGIKVLILHGVGDRLVPVSNSRRLAKLIPNTELIEFPACGHVPQEELPKEFIQRVQSFVEQG